MFISSTMTPFSRSISSESNFALRNMSTSTSSAMSRCSAAHFTKYAVLSLPVNALNSPPIASISPAICRALGRRSVPLKNMCSAKCAIPPASTVSYREPAANITITTTDCAYGRSAVRTRRPLSSVSRWNTVTPRDRIDVPLMYGEQTRRAIAAQPEWLAQVPTDRRFPDGAQLLFTGCGTSFHAAMTGGEAVQALELAQRPDREADLLVLVSHEGETPL